MAAPPRRPAYRTSPPSSTNYRLVSRVQGTYEFEVQPLREYFAARYLYETAPYSPPGAEKRGTKPDRFDALARNFYWLNVARFFAGCYSKGELPSIVDRLQELVQEHGYRNTSHPRVLAAMLLSDWVFAQHPKSMAEVVALVLDGLGLRYVLASRSQRHGPGAALVLPRECGRDELLDRCFAILRGHPTPDFAREVMEVARANASVEELKVLWLRETCRVHGAERTRWLTHGLYMGVLSGTSSSQVHELLSDAPENPVRIATVFRSRHHRYVEESEELCSVFVRSILSRDTLVHQFERTQSILTLCGQALEASNYARAFALPQRIPLHEVWRHSSRVLPAGQKKALLNASPSHPTLKKCLELVATAEEEYGRTAKEWATNLTPWDNIVEKSRSLWGEQWVHFHLATVAGGIKSVKEQATEFSDLLDHSKSLCRRARYARLRSGNPEWWKKQFHLANSEVDRMFVSLVALTWCKPHTIMELIDTLDTVLESLSSLGWQRLSGSLEEASLLMESHNSLLALDVAALPANLTGRLAAALGLRMKKNQTSELFRKYFSSYEGSDPVILGFCQEVATRLLQSDPTTWRKSLPIIAKSYAKGVVSDPYIFYSMARRVDTSSLPLEVAEEIVEHAADYPYYLVVLAEGKCREVVSANITPVSTVAQREGWFSD